MKKQFLLLGMASVFALTGCHGTKKVEFKEFGEAVQEAAKQEYTVKSVKVSGKYEDEKFKAFTVDLEKSETPELDDTQKKAYALGVTMSNVYTVYALLATGYGLAGDKALEGMTFYIGNGFKLKTEKDDSKATAEYDKKGLLVSYKGVNEKKTTKLSLKWTVEEKK